MPSELHWQLLRNHNCFIVRRNGVALSREPGNLAGKHSYKYSGLAHSKVVRIDAVPTGGVSFSLRKTKQSQNKLVNPFTTPTIVKRASGKGIARQLVATKYRPDLAKASKARVRALIISQRKSQPAPENKMQVEEPLTKAN